MARRWPVGDSRPRNAKRPGSVSAQPGLWALLSCLIRPCPSSCTPSRDLGSYLLRIDLSDGGSLVTLGERLTASAQLVRGGGVSAEADKWVKYLHCRAEIVPAKFGNTAGIIGAALAAV